MAQIKDSGDEIEGVIQVMKDGFLRDSFDLRFVLSVADNLIDALKRNVSEARWLEVKARIFDMVVAWQKEKGQSAAQGVARARRVRRSSSLQADSGRVVTSGPIFRRAEGPPNRPFAPRTCTPGNTRR